MKICFVGPAGSAHIVKWSNWFSNRGHEVHVISFTEGVIERAQVHHIDIGVDVRGSDLSKLKYLLAGKKIRNLISTINPDIINAHYATSYGAAMALSGVNDYILSVWGSDIYDFPQKSIIHKALLKYCLKKPALLLSTSKAMAKEASKYTKRHLEITPFGVDMNLFHPEKKNRDDSVQQFVVGTVKGLSDKYGIADILKAAAIIHEKGQVPIYLRIAGSGPQENEYKLLAQKLGIGEITKWLGRISQEEAAVEWSNMDVAVIPSTQESFGVSAVEAQACETAVIVSDIPGLMEATDPGKSSIVVHSCNYREIADVLERLYYNKELRQELAQHGRQYVLKHFELNQCFSNVEALFNNQLN